MLNFFKPNKCSFHYLQCSDFIVLCHPQYRISRKETSFRQLKFRSRTVIFMLFKYYSKTNQVVKALAAKPSSNPQCNAMCAY